MFGSKLQFGKPMDGAGDGAGAGGAGGAGDDGGAAALQEKIDAAVNAAVGGLKSKNSELLGKLKEAQTALKTFEGIDPEKVKGIMTHFESSEEAKLLAEGKMDEVINRRLAKREADWQSKLDTATKAFEAEQAKTVKFMGRVLDEQIRAAVNGKVHDRAVEDALYRARQMFSLNDEGLAVQLVDGQVVLGKDGKSPFSPAEWIESMRIDAPHWFPVTSSGSGAPASQGTGSKQRISRAQFDALPPAEQMAKVKAGVQVIDT